MNPPINELVASGLSAAEISELMNVKRTGITLKNGVTYDKDGYQLISKEHGKLKWAAAAIKKGYKKLPKPVRGFISKYTKLEVLLGLIDHFTGKVEDAIYWACKKVSMPSWTAWIVTKGLTLII